MDPGEVSFGFTKDTEAITRRPSFSLSLKALLEKKTKTSGEVAALLREKSAGYLLKKSSAGRFNKRWIAVHGHYLSYFRADPSEPGASPTPLGILDLWHVEGVSIDDATINLRLSPHAMQARQDMMGGDAAKKLIAANPLAKSVIGRLDQARRAGGEHNTFTLRAPDTKAAQAWLVVMRETPLMGSLASLHKALEDEGELMVKVFRVTMPPAREFIFADVASVLEDSTDILLRSMPLHGAVFHVSISAGKQTKDGEYQSSAPFEPGLQDPGGELVLQTPLQHDIKVKWKRKYPTYRRTASTTVLIFGLMTLVSLILTRSLNASVVMGILCAVGGAVVSVRQEQAQNNIVIKSITITKNAMTSSSPPGSPKSRRRAALSISKRDTKYVSTDPYVTPEEAALIVELRERVQDMWNVQPDVDAFIKRNERFLHDWHSDLSALKDVSRIKAVMDRHIAEDHRIVRFLRARKYKLDKAEHMLRDSLLWRVALGSDVVLQDPEVTPPPDWAARYFGPKHILSMIRPEEDSDKRLSLMFGRDKEGHLAIVFRAGRMNSRKIFKKMCSKPAYMMKLVIWATELLRNDLERYREKTPGKPETVLTVLIDLDGFAISEHIPIGDLIPIARRFFPIFATSYPELLHRVLVFNAPWLFGTLWTAVKPFIPEEVQEKIQIHSGDINYAKHIKPYVADEFVPKYLGGKMVGREDGNEFCTDIIAPFGPYGLPGEGQELLEGFDLKAQTW